MAQVFPRSADMWLRLALFILIGGLFALFAALVVLDRSDYITDKGWVVQQPVPFSHEHHAGALKIDCRYCHDSVEVSPVAGLPPTYTCMSCHSQIWTGAQMLAPVRQSLARQEPLRWNRVSELPDYVYFHHGVHVNAGVGCETCHGQVDTMPLMYRAETFTMSWCLDCHQNPAPRLRPRDAVTEMGWSTSHDRQQLGERLIRENHIETQNLTDCYICHR
ncbi:cytochrome c family protein [Pseudomonas stutzeri]|uniref:cytochrome c3 family protein n=1 Tax=Stutzerimonas stutzeri TaxID=316 RepID=UPI00210E4FE5|nr:cytochrome c3 family protein [Stutzerimonas stutzeri]MCQ4310871.1 cytochrome c family protein [Stutzerimonas stutzeri]